MAARPCRNSGHNSGITVDAQCNPCPMYSSAEHSVNISNHRQREIEGSVTSKTMHRFAMFSDKGRRVQRVTQRFLTRTTKSIRKRLVQGPMGKGPETVKTDVSYLDETEKLRKHTFYHHIYVDYWMDVI